MQKKPVNGLMMQLYLPMDFDCGHAFQSQLHLLIAAFNYMSK